MADETPKAPAPAAGLEIKTFQRPDSWWTFTVNGQESGYRSSNESGLLRTVKALMFGAPPGAIKLGPTVGAAGGGVATGDEWAHLPTQAERVKAFMSRGKFGAKKVDEAEAPTAE